MEPDDLRKWLIAEAALTADVHEDTPLFSSGLVDSFVMVELVVFVEQRAGIAFGPLDINLANMDTIASIVAFVRSRS